MADIITIDDMIDVRDIIARVEALEADDSVQAAIDALDENDDASELVALRELLRDLEGAGGDEQWRGDWRRVPRLAARPAVRRPDRHGRGV